jgi:hypothetical protein
MNPLLVTLGVHNGDLHLARTLLGWIVELGGCPRHHCLIVADASVPQSDRSALLALAKSAFASATSLPVPVAEQGWPKGANTLFEAAARQVVGAYRTPWCWLEPDCVPLASGWLDALSDAYHAQPRLMLGAIIDSGGQPGLPPRYTNGVAIYPPDAHSWMAPFTRGTGAFDIEAAQATVPRCTSTPLIHCHWGTRENPPEFVGDDTVNRQPWQLPLTFLRAGAVLFHRTKTSGLIDLLRARRATRTNGAPSTEVEGPSLAHDSAATRREARNAKARDARAKARARRESARQRSQTPAATLLPAGGGL